MKIVGKSSLFISCFLFFAVYVQAGLVKIIPEPAELKEGKGNFTWTASSKVVIGSGLDSSRQLINEFLTELRLQTGFKLAIAELEGTAGSTGVKHPVEDMRGGGMEFLFNRDLFTPYRRESYTIDVTTKGIRIIASDAAGMFYAIGSMRQAMTPKGLPVFSIRDYPAYSYRGMHLDVSRHFFNAAFVKRYIDLMARYKINTFHWHLTDSHGWRLEIKKYPKLTSVGAWRAPRDGIPMTIAEPTQPGEAATYGGSYTQEEVKEIIAYANARFVTIIPEIEMPGHCTAALVAYPEYCTQNAAVPLLMPTGYGGDLMHNFCVGNDSSFLFIENILQEVIDLFPSGYIHIGGDEVRGDPWLRCPRCQRLMQEKGFTTSRQLQAYFTSRIDSFVVSKGRKTMGWDEILEAGNLSKDATVVSWRGNEGGIEGAQKGHQVIMAPYRYVYLDFYQSAPELEPEITYAGLYLDSVYAFDPRPSILTPDQASNILGAQACLWTENVESPARAEYMLFPRMLALAEDVWTPRGRKDYRRFIDKLEHEFYYLASQKVNYAKSLYNPGFSPEYSHDKGNLSVTITDQLAGKYPVRYTLDGTAPSASSPVYLKPLTIDKTTTITAGIFGPQGQLLGKTFAQSFTFNKATAKGVSIESMNQDPGPVRHIADGIFGTIEPYDRRWLNYDDSIVTIRVDLGKPMVIDSVRFRCLEDQVGLAYLPGSYTLSVSSDGTNFRDIYTGSNAIVPQQPLRHVERYVIPVKGDEARFVRLRLVRAASLPAMPVSTAKPLLFIDEIEVY